VLVFIGLKMLCEKRINQVLDKQIQVIISLGVIMVCIAGSIFYSIFMQKKGEPADVTDESQIS
jgi:tellurite resistance protein TerC